MSIAGRGCSTANDNLIAQCPRYASAQELSEEFFFESIIRNSLIIRPLLILLDGCHINKRQLLSIIIPLQY